MQEVFSRRARIAGIANFRCEPVRVVIILAFFEEDRDGIVRKSRERRDQCHVESAIILRGIVHVVGPRAPVNRLAPSPSVRPVTRKEIRVPWRVAAAPAVLLLTQVVLYVWMAPRGFEFTDESFYLLNYLYWRHLTATVSFFGAYIEWPFRLMGQSILGIRILSLVLLLATTAFFGREVLRYSGRKFAARSGSRVPLVLVAMAASSFYFGYPYSVRAPSYNLIALCTMLVATGLLVRLATPGVLDWPARFTAFAYGAALGACALVKPPAGGLTVLLHGGFFAIANTEWRPPRLIDLASFCVAGVALNVGLLEWTDPAWLAAFREGVAMTNAVGHGGLVELARGLVQEVWSLAPAVLKLSAFAGSIIVLGRFIRHNRRLQISVAVVGVTGACALELARAHDRYLWLPVAALSVLILWSFETPWVKPSEWTKANAEDVATTSLLLVLPLAFSFGTNLVVLEHSQMAAAFGIAALLIALQRLADREQITRLAVGLSVGLLCVPTLTIQLQNAFDRGHAYRLRTALIDQTVPTRVGPANALVLVDTATRAEIAAIDSMARADGFVRQQPVLDLTGDGPGFVFLLRGRPLGVAWLSGGYPGTEVAATRLLTRLPLDALRNTWLLTSTANPRRILGWQRVLERRLGAGAYEKVSTTPIRSSYTWKPNQPEREDIVLWRPSRSKGLSGARPVAGITPGNP